jgi:hypothetical protein
LKGLSLKEIEDIEWGCPANFARREAELYCP